MSALCAKPVASGGRLPIALVVPLVALLLGAPAAHAQRLDLGASPAEPKPGDGLAVLALADLLAAEADGLADPDPRRAFRSLAADLLRAGENAGAPGAEAVLAGLTLAANRDELDALLRAHDDATRAYIADLISGAERSVLPREVDLLLRDALAPLATDPDAACGWWVVDPSDTALAEHTAALSDLVGSRRLTDDASAVLGRMVGLFTDAAGRPAYRRDAAAWAALLAGAAGALDEPPEWLDMPARDRLRAEFSTGVAACLDRPAEARTHLSRTASLVGIVRATAALEAAHQSRELRDAVNRLVGAAEGDPRHDPAAIARIAETYARALDLLGADTRAPAAGDLVRQTRPMLGPLADAHQRASDAVVRLLPTILTEPDPMTDPGVLAAMSSVQSTAADLGLPGELSTLLSTWTDDPSRPAPTPTREPLATREAGPLAERVRELAVALSRDEEHAAALAQLRSVARVGLLARELPGERELRAGGRSTAWQRATGGQTDRLLYLTDQARKQWIRSVAIEQFADRRDADEARLRTLAAVLPVLRDAAVLETIRTDWARKIPPSINRWPGVELTPEALDALAGDFARQAGQLAALAARGDDDAGALARASALGGEYAAAAVVARLDAGHPVPRACTIVGELGMGATTENAWRQEHRHALASLCRAAYEAAASEGPRRVMFLEYANLLGRRLAPAL